MEEVTKFEVLECHDSWGTASVRRKALGDTYGLRNLKIFKEITGSPFSALRHRTYYLCLRIRKDDAK